MGALKAGGQILAFIDDDAYPSITWLSRAVDKMQKKKTRAICGPGILPPQSFFWEKTFDEVLKTWVGSGGLSFRFVKAKERYIDDYPSMNFIIEKKLFLKVGGFGQDYWPGEDSKLCERIVYQEKEKILYSPDVYVYHHRRTSLLPYLKQHGQYGFHRGAFIAHGDKNSTRLFYFVPTLFLLYFLSLPGLLLLNLFFAVPLMLYGILMLYTMLSSLKNTKSLIIGLAAGLTLLLMHIWYGFHFIRGIVIGFVKKERIY
ncbi:MAG: Glycosyl transferase family 2 [Microgenomates bacterium OLB22]|nr:MAG: Glycosyl transferase family 2 [Microgenomates bacterium OLB22]